VALGALAIAAVLVVGKGLHGGPLAAGCARAALARLGYEPLGEPTVVWCGEQEVAWALERARAGPSGVGMAAGEGGARRYRVVFPTGGEAEVTESGLIWSARRPIPSNPGAGFFPSSARPQVEERLQGIVTDVGLWRLVRVHSWREGGLSWQRGFFSGGSGELPAGWQRELDLDVVGSTVVSFRRHVYPLGTDLGVVKGRMAELGVLRAPAQLGLALVALGLMVAAGEALAFHERIAYLRGCACGVAAFSLAALAGSGWLAASAEGALVAVAVGVLPTWTWLPRSRLRWGAVAGVAVAVVVLVGRWAVLAAGGWVPETPPAANDPTLSGLVFDAWLPVLVEEPLLRGVLPGMAGPYLGWWGAALVGVPVGAALHALPAVPLAASFAIEMAAQLVLVVIARRFGVAGAVMASGVSGMLVRRSAYPVGWVGDAVTLMVLALAALALVWRTNGYER
jgi:hypothetical protein